MGLTERHWFENEEPELTDRQLEDIAYENKKAYDSGYIKGYHDAMIKYPDLIQCSTMPKKSGWDNAYEVACNIIQTFEPDYPSPTVDEIVRALISASTITKSNKLNDIVKWAKDYAEKWYNENMK